MRAPDENAPPEQKRTIARTVEAQRAGHDPGARRLGRPRRRPVLPASRGGAGPRRGVSTADGIVVFDEHGGAGGDAEAVTLVVVRRPRRGRRRASRSSCVAPGDVPIVVEPWVALATAGQEITHPARAPRARRERAAAAERGAGEGRGRDRPRLRGGHLHLHERRRCAPTTSSTPSPTATRRRPASSRVDVAAPPDRQHDADHRAAHDLPPTLQQPSIVDAIATDIDPAGGVLIVTGVTDPAEDEGVRAEVLDHRDPARHAHATARRPPRRRSTTASATGSPRPKARSPSSSSRRPRSSSRRSPPTTRSPCAPATSSTSPCSTTTSIPMRAAHARARLARGAPTAPGCSSPPATACATWRPRSAGDFTAVYRVEAADGQFATRERARSRCARRTPRRTPPRCRRR